MQVFVFFLVAATCIIAIYESNNTGTVGLGISDLDNHISPSLPELDNVDRWMLEQFRAETGFVWEEEADISLSLPSSSNSSPNGIATPLIAGDNFEQGTFPANHPTRADSDSYWDLSNDTNAEFEHPMLLLSPTTSTGGEDKHKGENQYNYSSGSNGSPLWALGTSALLFGLVDFEADKLDVWIEEDEEQDGGDDHANPRIIEPPDGYGPDVEHEIDDELYHPTLLAYWEKTGDVDIVLERLMGLGDEKTELEKEKETRQQIGLNLNPNDEAWLLASDGIWHELHEKLNAYEAQAAALKHECLLHGLIDDEGEPLPAALGWKTKDIPTPNSEDLEKSLITATEINARTAILPVQSPTQLKQRYSCLCCNKLFQRQCSLRKHIKTHTKPHACHFASCTLAFATNKDLRRHVEARHTIHDKKAEFVCFEESCQKPFSRRDNLLRHRKKAHGGT